MIASLEKYLEYSASFILLLKLSLLFFVCKRFSILSKYSTKWLTPLSVCFAILAVCEWVLIEWIFQESFPYYKSHIFPFLNSMNLEHMTFFNPLHYIIRFGFIGLFFRDLIKNKKWKISFEYVVWGLIIFQMIQIFIFSSYQGYDSLSSTIKNIFILLGTGLLLYQIYHNNQTNMPLNKNLYFWVCLGLLLPALSELFIEFILTKLYHTDTPAFYKSYLVRNICQVLGFILLIVGVQQAKYLRFLPKEY